MAHIHKARCEIPSCKKLAAFEIPQFYSPKRGGFHKLWVCSSCNQLTNEEIIAQGINPSHLYDAYHDGKTGQTKRTPKSLTRDKEKARKAELAEETYRKRYEQQFS